MHLRLKHCSSVSVLIYMLSLNNFTIAGPLVTSFFFNREF